LSAHLAPLRRSEKVEIWTDKAIQAGEKWDAAIDGNLNDASVVLLLLSADFVASSYIWEKEIPMAEELKKNTNATIIPIYMRPFDFAKLSFSELEMIPKVQDTQVLTAISEWDSMDGAFKVVAEEIRKVIERS
jgi:internalin A